jgi:hypothetical protein
MNAASTALPKRLLRIKRQSARLAELQTLQAATAFRRAQGAADAERLRLKQASADMATRIRKVTPVETLQAAAVEIETLIAGCSRLDSVAAEAGEAYRAAIAQRRKLDGEIESLEELLARREFVLRKQDEQQRQQHADDWTLRHWNDVETEGSRT